MSKQHLKYFRNFIRFFGNGNKFGFCVFLHHSFRFPHPITYVGMMEMGSAYLPITESWRQFYDKCNEESSERNNKAAQGLGQASLQIVKELSPSDAYMNDPWMWICDWTEHKKLFKPKWYLNLFKTNEKATQTEDIASTDIKFKCRDVPRVFGICYGPFPLHYKADYGWGYLVPNSDRSREYSDAESVKVRRGDVVSIPNKLVFNVLIHYLMMCISEQLWN